MAGKVKMEGSAEIVVSLPGIQKFFLGGGGGVRGNHKSKRIVG